MKNNRILSYKLLCALMIFFAVAIFYTFPRPSILGLVFFESYEFEKAYEYLTRAQDLEPNNIYVYKKLKEYMLYKGQVNKALELQKKLTELRPNNLEYHQELEKLFGWVGDDYSKLIEREKILSLNKDLSNSEKIERYVEIAEGHRWLRKYEDAKRVYKQIIKSGDPKVLHKAQNFFNSISDIESSKIIFTKFLDNSAIDRDAVFSMGETLFFTKKYLEAIPYFIWVYTSKKWEKDIYPYSFLSPTVKIDKNTIYSLQMIFLSLKKASEQEKSLSFYEDVISIYPKLYQVRIELISEYLKSSNPKLNSHIEYFLENNNPTKYELDVVSVLNTSKQFQDSLKILLKIERKEKNNEEVLKKIAETYEILGEKELSLKYYTKLLKLKEENANTINNVLYAKNDFIKSDVHIIREKKRKTNPNDIIWLRLKVADLSEELKKTNLSLEQLQKLHKENPVDIKILEKIGERYVWYGKNDEAKKIYLQIHKIRPDHQKANFYLALSQVEDGHAEDAFRKLSELTDPEITSTTLFQSTFEESAFNTKRMAKHQEICKPWSAKANEIKLSEIEKDLIFRCLYRGNLGEDALIFIENRFNKQKNAQLATQIIDISLEMRKLENAKKYLKFLKLQNEMTEYNNNQEYYLDELIWNENQQLSWKITQYNRLSELNNFSLLKSGAEISKNINSDFKYGLDTYLKKSLSLISVDYTVLSPFLRYVAPKDFVQIHYSHASGDRKFQDPSVSLELQHFVNSHLSIGFDLNTSEIEDITKELLSISDLDKKTATLHSSYSNRKIHGFISSQYNKVSTPRSKGVNTIQYFESSYDVRQFHLSPGIKLSYQKFSSDQNELNTLYISKSFPQYVFVKSDIRKRFTQELNFTGEAYFSVGQDTIRDIHFGKLINPGISFEILYKHTYNIKAGFDYYNFSLLGASGHYQLAQLSIGAVF